MTSTSEQFLKSKGIVELCKVDFGYSFDLMQLQSVSWYFETFRCFTKFSFYHKWNDVRLLLINMVYTSFPTTQDLRNEEISIPWAIAAAASTQQAATRIKHSAAKSKKAEARHHRASPQGRQEPPTNHEQACNTPGIRQQRTERWSWVFAWDEHQRCSQIDTAIPVGRAQARSPQYNFDM